MAGNSGSDDPFSRPPGVTGLTQAPAPSHVPAPSSAPDSGNTPRPRSAIRWKVAAAVVAVAVLTGGIVIATRDDSNDTTSTPTLSAGTTTTGTVAGVTDTVAKTGPVTADTATTVTSTDGVSVEVPAGAVVGDGIMIFTPVATPPGDLGEALTPAGPLVDITLNGTTLTGQVRITIPVTDPNAFELVTGPDGTLIDTDPALVIAHWTGTEWEELDTTIDRTAGDNAATATALTSSLSPFGLFRIAANFIKDVATNAVKAVTGGIYTDVPTPTCRGTDITADWEANPANNPVSWCAATDVSGDTHIQVANRRRYAITVSAPAGIVTGRTTDLAAQLSELTFRTNTAVLAPGDTADITFPAAATDKQVIIEYDGLAQSISSLVIAADILSTVATKVPFSKAKSAKEFLATMHLADCFRAVGIDPVASVTNPASTLVTLLKACFDNVTGIIGRVLSATLATIFGVVAYFISSGSALFDLIVGGANGTLTAVPAVPAESASAQIPAAFHGSWSGQITSNTSGVTPFNVTVSIDATGGRIDVDGSSQCRGILTAVTATDTLVTMTGTWESGRCVASGIWELTKPAPDIVHYRWNDPGGTRYDEGDLTQGGQEPGPAFSVWPVGDNEGPSTLYALMGAMFTFPDWVSCSSDYCIAGEGVIVRLYRLAGLEDLGVLPTNTPDPVTVFLEAGIPAEQVTAFMTSGSP